MSDAAAFIEDAKELPVMPPVAAEVMRMAEDPDTDIAAISELISRDASLVVRVLKIANSSFYAMPREIETIQQAIVLLGYSTLRSVVVAASMKDVFARFGLAERLLWEHGVAAAVASSVLSSRVRGIAAEELFVGGLLHDIGKLVMYSQAESKYQEVMTPVYSSEADPIEQEIQVFGFDHCEVGRLVLDKWKLPSRLAMAVGFHHDPAAADDGEHKPLAAALQVADLIALREGLGRRKPDPEIQPFASAGAQVLGVVDVDPEECGAEFREAYETERGVFG